MARWTGNRWLPVSTHGLQDMGKLTGLSVVSTRSAWAIGPATSNYSTDTLAAYTP